MSVRACLLVSLLLVTLAFFGCGQKPPATTETPSGPASTAKAPGPTGPAAAGGDLGEQIYTKGTGPDGQHLAFTKGGAKFVAKPGGCANCHGTDGLGHKMPKMTIPPIRASVLFAAGRYTEQTIRKAVVTGMDEKGTPLDPVMPRWKMTDDELVALVSYLKVLDTKPANPPKPAGPAKPMPAAPKTK